jgi:hypothetical protein
MKTTDLNYFLPGRLARATPRFTLNLWTALRVPAQTESRKSESDVAADGQKVDDGTNFGPRVALPFDLTGDEDESSRRLGNYLRSRDLFVSLQFVVNTELVRCRSAPVYYQRYESSGCLRRELSAGRLRVAADLSETCCRHRIRPWRGAVTSTTIFNLPQIHQWDFHFEREIARNTVVSASYIGSFGNSLPNFVDTNLHPAATPRVL